MDMVHFNELFQMFFLQTKISAKKWSQKWPLIIIGVKLYSQCSLNCILPTFQYLYCLKVTISYKVDSKSLKLRKSDSLMSQREVRTSRYIWFFMSCFSSRKVRTPWQSRMHAAKGRLLRVFGMFVARCQRCNPAMTDNVTARLCLRGSPYKEEDCRKARKT